MEEDFPVKVQFPILSQPKIDKKDKEKRLLEFIRKKEMGESLFIELEDETWKSLEANRG